MGEAICIMGDASWKEVDVSRNRGESLVAAVAEDNSALGANPSNCDSS